MPPAKTDRKDDTIFVHCETSEGKWGFAFAFPPPDFRKRSPDTVAEILVNKFAHMVHGDILGTELRYYKPQPSESEARAEYERMANGWRPNA